MTGCDGMATCCIWRYWTMRRRDRKRLGLLNARTLGHTVSGWTPDVYGGDYLATCSGCDRYMAITDEDTEPFGFLVRERCPRRRMP